LQEAHCLHIVLDGSIGRNSTMTVWFSLPPPHFTGALILQMRYLHTMLRVADLEKSLDFFVAKLGLVEVKRYEVEQGRFSLVYLAPPGQEDAQIELTYNWDPEQYNGGRNFGHVAYEVADIYAKCADLAAKGVTINRPPRDGYMAFVRSPDGISVELLQTGEWKEPAEPWKSMPNIGEW
jgi:lactoylglutathione lyase